MSEAGSRAGAKAKAAAEAATPSERLYRPQEVVELLRISRRQLQYWVQTDLVRPSVRTPGGHHRYSFEDLVALKAAKRLIDAGVSVQRIRRSLDALEQTLPRVQRPLSELVLVATGDVVLVFGEETVFEAVTGQEWVFEVARFQREVEAWARRAPLGGGAGVRPVRHAGKATRARRLGG